MIALNTNTSALNAAKNLAANSSKLGSTLEQMSSGKRINAAKDDAAGLAMVESMTSRIRGLNVAAKNASDLIGLLETTDQAIAQMTNNVQRIRELAVQSANGTLSDNERGYLQDEVNELTSENARLFTLKYGDNDVFPTGAYQDTSIQIGSREGETLNYPHITKDIHSRTSIDISTQAAAETVIDPNGTWGGSAYANDSLTQDFVSLSTMRSRVGAISNRLNSVITGIEAEKENTESARARIQDTDYAKASADLARTQVLKQAGIAMLTQANMSSSNVMKLIQ